MSRLPVLFGLVGASTPTTSPRSRRGDRTLLLRLRSEATNPQLPVAVCENTGKRWRAVPVKAKSMVRNQQSTTPTHKNAAPSAYYIVVELRGGPHQGQHVRVPHDEFYLQLTDCGKPVSYSRYNNAPIFHHEDAIVAVLGGGAKR